MSETLTPTVQEKDEALDAIKGFREIVRAEMLGHVGYLTSAVQDQDRAERGAVCGGRKACAVGSLYLGGHVKLRFEEFDGQQFGELPGVEQGTRRRYLRRHPGLRLAYFAMNAGANRRLEALGRGTYRPFEHDGYEGALEILFERVLRRASYADTRETMLRVATDAARLIREDRVPS